MDIYSAVVCDQVQELEGGELNYLSVFNEIYGLGDYVFDLALNYYGEDEKFVENIRMYSPSGEVLIEEINEIIREEATLIHTSITTFEFDFETTGMYSIKVSVDGRLLTVPIYVHNDVY